MEWGRGECRRCRFQRAWLHNTGMLTFASGQREYSTMWLKCEGKPEQHNKKPLLGVPSMVRVSRQTEVWSVWTSFHSVLVNISPISTLAYLEGDRDRLICGAVCLHFARVPHCFSLPERIRQFLSSEVILRIRFIVDEYGNRVLWVHAWCWFSSMLMCNGCCNVCHHPYFV